MPSERIVYPREKEGTACQETLLYRAHEWLQDGTNETIALKRKILQKCHGGGKRGKASERGCLLENFGFLRGALGEVSLSKGL